MKGIVSRFKPLFFSMICKDGWSGLKEADVLVTRHDADCGYRYEEKSYSPIIDTIVENCFHKSLSVQSVATPFSQLTGSQAFNSPVAFNRSFFAIALLVRVLSIFIGKENGKRFGDSRKTAVWLRILKRVNPKIVIGIQPDIGLCRASRSMNIPVYDIQHGAIGIGDKWYGNILPKTVDDSDLPSGFLCWDHQSTSDLQNWAPKRGMTINVVGNPWFQRFQYPDDKDVLVQHAIRSGHIFADEKPVVLVALQWGLHLHYYPEKDFNKVMCKALEDVIKRTHGRYNWLLRLHPVQLTGDEGRFCEDYLSREFGVCSGVEWHNASLIPLPLLLSQADLHITDMSAVVISASSFGVPSALLNPYLNEGGILEKLYEYERKSGIATVVNQDVDAIESWIEEKLSCTRETSALDIPRGGIQALLDKAMAADE